MNRAARCDTCGNEFDPRSFHVLLPTTGRLYDAVRCATQAELRALPVPPRRTRRRRTVEERRRRWFERAGTASLPTGASG